MPQLRQNIITGDWVVFAPERAKRPSDYVSIAKERTQKKEECPFCIDSKKSEFENRHKEFDLPHTYVLTNKYPAFIEDGDSPAKKMYKIEDEFYKMKLALGGHDVVVVKEHDQALNRFDKAIYKDMYMTFKKRFQYFSKIENVEYVMPIYNHGPEAAASIDHPHSQIFASAVIPNTVARELQHTSAYFEANKKCAFCDLIEHEKSQNTRVIAENDEFIAFSFYAARFPFEVWLLPKDHSSNFEGMSEAKIESFAQISTEIMKKYDETLNDPPMNFFIHSEPIKQKEKYEKSYHWHMEFAPRLANYGGYEMGSGMVIDIITPESAAEYLRLSRKN